MINHLKNIAYTVPVVTPSNRSGINLLVSGAFGPAIDSHKLRSGEIDPNERFGVLSPIAKIWFMHNAEILYNFFEPATEYGVNNKNDILEILTTIRLVAENKVIYGGLGT